MLLDVFRQVSTGHPIRNELEGSDSDAQERYNVWVRQPFPHHGLLAEGLWVLSIMANGGDDGVNNAHLSSLLWPIPSIHPYTLDANRRTVEAPLVHVTVTSRGKRVGSNVQNVRGNRVRRREYRSVAAYASQLT